MYVVCVQVHVAADRVEEFVEATAENAAGARSEPGNLRFDLLRQNDDPTRLFLYEVYRSQSDFKTHQKTPHYLAWRARVAPMMASPRIGSKHTSLLPDPWD